jgi:multidrug resistance efflux pump
LTVRVRFHREARTTPEAVDGLKVPYAPAKRKSPKWRWWLILAVVLSPALYLVFTALRSLLILSANGTVMLEQYEVRATGTGQLVELAAVQGTLVSRGQILARIRDASLEAAIASGRTQRREPRKVDRRTEAGLREELELHQRVLSAAQERVAVVKELIESRAATSGELREAQIAADEAAVAVLRLQRQLAGQPVDEVLPTSDLQRLLAAREQLTIRAPVSGRVLELHAGRGEFVTAGTPLLQVAVEHDPRVLAYIAPELSSKVKVGTRATITFPDKSKVQAVVADRSMLTRRLPADLVNQFGARPLTIVLNLQTDAPWPESHQIHGLPVTVRFHYAWEPQLKYATAAR